MLYGVYLSAQGAEAQSVRLDTLANNLANARTSAFKRDLALFQAHQVHDRETNSFAPPPPGHLNDSSGGLSLAQIATDFSQGPLEQTGGTYHVALTGPGFLQVTDGRSQFLTRNGTLTVNQQGELITEDSALNVLDASGKTIVVPRNATDVEIAPDGTVYSFDPSGARLRLGRIASVVPEDVTQLQKIGDSLYQSFGKLAPTGPQTQFKQGYLESSGVQPVMEMMELIQATRAFEANLNMIKFQDDSLGRLLQSASRK